MREFFRTFIHQEKKMSLTESIQSRILKNVEGDERAQHEADNVVAYITRCFRTFADGKDAIGPFGTWKHFDLDVKCVAHDKTGPLVQFQKNRMGFGFKEESKQAARVLLRRRGEAEFKIDVDGVFHHGYFDARPLSV